MELLNSYEQMQGDGQFFYAFLKAALWASPYYAENEEDDLEFLEDAYSFSDINQQSADMIQALCVEFIEKAGVDAICERNFAQAGHDFFLTIAGHGCGFWDGDWPVNGDNLTQLCSELVRHIEVYSDGQQVYIDISEAAAKEAIA